MDKTNLDLHYEELEANISAIEQSTSQPLLSDTSQNFELVIENENQPQKSYKYNNFCEASDTKRTFIKSDNNNGFPVVSIKCKTKPSLNLNESLKVEVSLSTALFKIHPYLLKSNSINRLGLSKEELLEDNNNSNVYRYYYNVNMETFESVLDGLSIIQVPEHIIKDAIELDLYRREQQMGKQFKDPISFLSENQFKKYGDLNVSRLKFQLVLYDNNKHEFVKYLTSALYSDLITDTKSEIMTKTFNINHSLTDSLRIISCSKIIGSMFGNDKLIIFTNELNETDDLAIEFYQIENNKRVWEQIVNLKPENIYNKCAIWFLTPKYNEQLILDKQAKVINNMNNHVINYKHLIKEHPVKVYFRLFNLHAKQHSSEWPFYYSNQNCTILNHFNTKQLSELHRFLVQEDGDEVMKDRNLAYNYDDEDSEDEDETESTNSESSDDTEEDTEAQNSQSIYINNKQNKDKNQTKTPPKQDSKSNDLRLLVLDRKKKMNGLADRTAASLLELSKTRSLHKVLKTQRYLLNTQNRDGNTPLHLCLLNGNYDLLEIIVDCALTIPHYNIIDVKNNYQLSVLLMAAHLGEAEVCDFMLEANASINETDLNGNNCFHIACQKRNLKLVKVLVNYIKKNIDKSSLINVCNYEGETPLHIAVRLNCYEIVEEFLYTPGIRLEEKNKRNGMNALHYSAAYGFLQVTRLLLEYLKKEEKRVPNFIDAQANNGCTPLHMAIANNNLLIVRLLLKYNASPFVQSIEFAHPMCECTNMKQTNSISFNFSMNSFNKKNLTNDVGEKMSEDVRSNEIQVDNRINILSRHNCDAYDYAGDNFLLMKILRNEKYIPKSIINKILQVEFNKRKEKTSKNKQNIISQKIDFIEQFEKKLQEHTPGFQFNRVIEPPSKMKRAVNSQELNDSNEEDESETPDIKKTRKELTDLKISE